MNDKKLYDNHFVELRKIVVNSGLLKPTPVYGSINIGIFILLYFLGLFLIGNIHIIFIIIYYFVLTVELGFISHDLTHNQYFKNKKLNKFLSLITGNLLIGLSESWWKKKHNVAHHTFTNSDTHDTDLTEFKLFKNNDLKSNFISNLKIFLFWVSTALMYFNLIFLSYKHIIKNKLFLELVISLCYFLMLPLVLFFNYGLLATIGILIIMYIFVGIHLAFSFMVNHIGMEIIDGNEVKNYSWFDLQTRTSRNIKGGKIINHIFGGLNKQVEHHIFPGVSRKNITELSRLVENYCVKNDIKYHNVTFRQSLKEIYRTLKTGETVK